MPENESPVGLESGTVRLVSYSAAWHILFAEEKKTILSAMKGRVLAVEHIGSTAIPDMEAKPIIDIAAAVRSADDIQDCIQPLAAIGYAGGPRDPLFQLSTGDSQSSLDAAAVALDSAADLNLTGDYPLRPLLEPRFSDRSYLYNTDGVIFADAGYPVVLINEHLNYYSTLMREAYHDSTDTSYIINFDYAVAITKVAIETVARLAGAPAAH